MVQNFNDAPLEEGGNDFSTENSSLTSLQLDGWDKHIDVRQLNLESFNSSASCLPECDIGNWLTEERHAEIDGDKDGFITKDEISEAMKTGNYSESEKITLRYMRRGMEHIQEASDDEWFDENDGITVADAKAYKPYHPNLQFEPFADAFNKDEMVVWASTIAEKLNFPQVEGQNYTNAFRHVLTTSMYALKYGDVTAMTLADSNELITGARDTMEEWYTGGKNLVNELRGNDAEDVDTEWRYDTRADDWNNLVGLGIAQDLRKEANESGNPVTMGQLMGRVLEALNNGHAITDIYGGKNQYGDLLQDPQVNITQG